MKKAVPTIFIVLSVLALFAVAQATQAQTSPSYQNKEHTVNGGGNPTPVLASTNYKITLSSIGEGISGAGMSSPGYQIDGGFVPPYPPPGEVLDLWFTNKTTMGWDPEPSVGSYDVYRGSVSGLPASYGTCLTQGLTATQATDATVPAAGQCFFYLITAENRIAEEGTMGKDSAGTPRPNTAPCP
jgi:hypothetical protein